MANATFRLHICSTERDFYEGDCASLSLPLSDGEIGLLAFHSPIAAAVVPGTLRFRLPKDGGVIHAKIGPGLVRFENNDALVLLESIEQEQSGGAEAPKK